MLAALVILTLLKRSLLPLPSLKKDGREEGEMSDKFISGGRRDTFLKIWLIESRVCTDVAGVSERSETRLSSETIKTGVKQTHICLSKGHEDSTDIHTDM